MRRQKNDYIFNLSQNGRYFAIARREPKRRGIDVLETAESRYVARHDFEDGDLPIAICFDAGGERLAVILSHPGAKQSVSVWDFAAQPASPPRPVIHGDLPFISGFSDDGRFVVVHENDRITLHDPWTGKGLIVLAEAQPGRVHHSSFSNDGRYFAAVVASDRVRIWETESGRELTGFKIDDSIAQWWSVRWEHGWLWWMAPCLTLFDRASWQKKVLTNVRGHRITLNGVPAFSRDEKLLAVSSRKEPGGEASLEVWDLATLCRIGAYSGRGVTGAAAFLAGGRSIVLAAGTTPRIWRLDSPTEPDAIAAHIAEAWTVGFSPDAQILATGSDDTRDRQTIKLWDPATGRLIAGWTAHTATVTSLAFSPDGRILASASLDSGKPGNHNVILWDARTHQRLANLDGHTDRVRSLAFSPDGRFLATASDDLTADLGHLIQKCRGHSVRTFQDLNSIA